MTYFTIQQIKDANRAAGHHFFERGAMRFFNSRVLDGIIGGHYFITSERFSSAAARAYTVRHVDDLGHIVTAGQFQHYDTPAQARAAARKLADGWMECGDCGEPSNALDLGLCPQCVKDHAAA